MSEPKATVSMDELRANLSLVDALPPDVAKQVWIELRAMETALFSRFLVPEPERLLTVPQVAETLQISAYQTRVLIRQGRIKHTRVCGKLVRVRPTDLTAYIVQQGH